MSANLFVAEILKNLWIDLSNSISENHETFDFRNARDSLQPLAEKCLLFFETFAATETDPKFALAHKVVVNAHEWVLTWPTNDPTQRNIARTERATGNYMTADEAIRRLGEDNEIVPC